MYSCANAPNRRNTGAQQHWPADAEVTPHRGSRTTEALTTQTVHRLPEGNHMYAFNNNVTLCAAVRNVAHTTRKHTSSRAPCGRSVLKQGAVSTNGRIGTFRSFRGHLEHGPVQHLRILVKNNVYTRAHVAAARWRRMKSHTASTRLEPNISCCLFKPSVYKFSNLGWLFRAVTSARGLPRSRGGWGTVLSVWINNNPDIRYASPDHTLLCFSQNRKKKVKHGIINFFTCVCVFVCVPGGGLGGLHQRAGL